MNSMDNAGIKSFEWILLRLHTLVLLPRVVMIYLFQVALRRYSPTFLKTQGLFSVILIILTRNNPRELYI